MSFFGDNKRKSSVPWHDDAEVMELRKKATRCDEIVNIINRGGI